MLPANPSLLVACATDFSLPQILQVTATHVLRICLYGIKVNLTPNPKFYSFPSLSLSYKTPTNKEFDTRAGSIEKDLKDLQSLKKKGLTVFSRNLLNNTPSFTFYSKYHQSTKIAFLPSKN